MFPSVACAPAVLSFAMVVSGQSMDIMTALSSIALRGFKVERGTPEVVACLVAIFIALQPHAADCQAPGIQWQASLGGTWWDQASEMVATSDGGFIAAGITSSQDGDVSGHHGDVDIWVVKMDSNGGLQWSKCLGGSQGEGCGGIEETSDGGYIVLGSTSSNDGDVSASSGFGDMWFVKLSNTGTIQWEEAIGTGIPIFVSGYSVHQLDDGGFVGVGQTGTGHILVTKLSSTGALEWNLSLVGNSNESPSDIIQASNGDLLLVGHTGSNDSTFPGNHGSLDIFVTRISSLGNVLWTKLYGGSDYDNGYRIEKRSLGGYNVLGWTWSDDGDVMFNNGFTDGWLLSIDESGNLISQQTFGGSGADRLDGMAVRSNDAIVLAGRSESDDGYVNCTPIDSASLVWVLEVTPNGVVSWSGCYGGSNDEVARAIIEKNDGTLVVFADSWSNDGDVLMNHDPSGFSPDWWIFQLGTASSVNSHPESLEVHVFPNPCSSYCDMKFVYPGHASLGLYNSRGELLVSDRTEQGDYTLDMTKLSEGVYILRVSTERGTEHHRISKIDY